MASPASASAAPPSTDRAPRRTIRSRDARPAPERRIGRRERLPGGRAIVGGFLVTVAAVTTFAAYTAATAGPTHDYVVAAIAINAGHRIGPDDLRSVKLDLTDDVARQAFDDPRELEGSVALSPLEPDELVARGAIRQPDAGDHDGSVHELSFSLERDHVLDGQIRRGEQVDVLATYGSGAEAYTLIVSRQARVIDLDTSAKGGIASSGKVVLTLALDSEAQLIGTTHAVEVAKVTVVRSSDAGGQDASPEPSPTAAAPYTAPGPHDRGDQRAPATNAPRSGP
jgi:Flp pilus assembly protein CpaB